MKRRWVSYLTRDGGDLVPRVVEAEDGPCRSRRAALSALRRELEREHKAAQENVAETGRALATLLELEHTKP